MKLVRTALVALLASVFFGALADENANFYKGEMRRGVQAESLVIGGGWSLFFFGGPGSTASPDFSFTAPYRVKLIVSDNACTGDQFEVFANGGSLGLTSSPLTQVCIGQAFDESYANIEYSARQFILGPGTYTIRMKAVLSPFGGGSGQIRVDRDDGQCKRGSIFTVFTTSSTEAQARAACGGLGAGLARVDIGNWQEGTTVAWSCLGPFSSAWVDSWFGNNYGDTCIALSTGVANPGGSINAFGCDSRRRFMCS